jgi:prepilin-type N-terminal cleavage/methylation domain-containing protein
MTFPAFAGMTLVAHFRFFMRASSLQYMDLQMVEYGSEKGFTLIELMIVIAIIGILAAIAFPQLTVYRKQANDRAALTQLKDMATAEEAYFSANGSYTTSLTDLENFGFRRMVGVNRTRELIDKNGNAGTTVYKLTTSHPSGTGKIFVYQSDNGGLQ